MDQLHRRFTVEQVKVLLHGYAQGTLSRAEAQEMLGLGKTRFFAWLRAYRADPAAFSIAYERETPARLSASTERAIAVELRREQKLVEDRRLPISDYNYSAIRDRLEQKGVLVSTTTITTRAKQLGCYRPHPKGKAHDREVVTAAIGALVQHDASVHLWSPFATEKWTLITSLDDYSRKLLYADFFPQETAWTHIQAAQSLMQTYGLPLRYYVDNLRVFRFVQRRDSHWRKHILETDEVDPQWRQVLRLVGVDVLYALSPQAKGKVERPYRWLQDRIVRTCALEHITSLDEARAVLKEELNRYNHRQIHSTTGEIPDLRFAHAQSAGQSLFRPFVVPAPYRIAKDVFCLRETRVVNGYRRISLFDQEFLVPHVPLREQVEVHIVPDFDKQLVDLRLWWSERLVHSFSLPLNQARGVHF
jgi:transposase